MRVGFVIAILIISLGVGIGAGELVEEYTGSPTDVSPVVVENCSNDCGQGYDQEYGAGWIVEKRDGPLYSFNKPNASGWADYLGVPDFYVRTNRYGMRDEEFQIQKPENTVRVLILGTSTAFGYGVNRSYTFTEIVEDRLNNNFSGINIQLLNAGSPGYGMKDFYLYLKNEGLRYNPDIVVVAFTDITWRSREDTDDWQRKVKQRLRERRDYRNLTEVEKRHLRQRYLRDVVMEEIEKGIRNTDFTYIGRIENLSESKNLPVVYYSVDPLRYPDQKEYLESWAEKHNTTIHYPPKELWRGGVKYDNSELDTHPNIQGHQLISDGLYPVLVSKINESMN